MNRADRGPLLLIVAGLSSLLAVVACLINDADNHSRWREAALHDRQAVRAQVQRSTAELRVHAEERDQYDRRWAELQGRNDAVLKSLTRIENLLETAARSGPIAEAGDAAGDR